MRMRLLAVGCFVLQSVVLVQTASAQCADPRGNAYCTNSGLVNVQNPNPQQNVTIQNPNPPTNVNVANPNPPSNVNVTNPIPPMNVNVQNPQPATNVSVSNPSPPTNVNVTNPNPPSNVNVTNPTPPMNLNVQNPQPATNVSVSNPNPPTNVSVQNPNPPTDVNVTNPTGGDSGAQNPNAPIATATTGQLTVAPAGGAPGDMLAVSGQGFGADNLMFLNVVDSAGNILDTDSRAFTCTETDDFLLNLYQDLGWGCSSGARQGPLNQTNADGTFTGAIQIPAEAVPGPAQLCAKGVFPDSCTPITIAGPGDD